MSASASFFVKGGVIGFSIAAPVGPIGLLCIRRSLADGPRVGLATGLGAATADAVYGAIAGFGLTAVSTFLVGKKFWLGLVGGAFLCYLGARTFFSKPPATPENKADTGLASAYASTFFLTLTNPGTILSFVAVFAGFGLGAAGSYAAAAALVAGVFTGSALWWLILSQGVGRARSLLSPSRLMAVNRISGSILAAFGVWAIWQAAKR